jgi:hypothetical protein
VDAHFPLDWIHNPSPCLPLYRYHPRWYNLVVGKCTYITYKSHAGKQLASLDWALNPLQDTSPSQKAL